jgi:hypothetical protein
MFLKEWDDVIKMDLTETGCEDMNWLNLLRNVTVSSHGINITSATDTVL